MSLTFLAILGAALLGIIGTIFGFGRKSGNDARVAKEAQAREENLRRIQAAIDAGDRPVDSLHDPHNRDTQ